MVVEGSSLPSIRPQAKLAERGLESLWGPVLWEHVKALKSGLADLSA